MPFRPYFDELITLTGASPETIAAMFEDFRKYRCHVHGMTQLLSRLPTPVRLSLVQNASTLATTAGSTSSIAPITAEWGDNPSPDRVATMERFEHFVSLNVHGHRVGPLQLRGPHLDDVFAAQARPKNVAALERAAQANARALPWTSSPATPPGSSAASPPSSPRTPLLGTAPVCRRTPNGTDHRPVRRPYDVMAAHHPLVADLAREAPLGAVVIDDLEEQEPTADVWVPLVGGEPRPWRPGSV